MIATLPAVQRNCKRGRRWGSFNASDKRLANRRHRRALDRVTRSFERDLERWYDEGFNAPSLDERELW